MQSGWTYLESLVLQYLLDRDVSISRIVQKPGLENDTERTVSDDLAIGIGDFSLLARLAIGSDDLDDLAGIVNR